MNGKLKAASITGLVCLVIGALLGYLPAHGNFAQSQEQNSALKSKLTDTAASAAKEHDRLVLSNFAVQAAELMNQAAANNYSVASGQASALFTELRKYVDQGADGAVKQNLQEVLGSRDRTIAGLAQANSSVRPLLAQIFEKLSQVSADANR